MKNNKVYFAELKLNCGYRKYFMPCFDKNEALRLCIEYAKYFNNDECEICISEINCCRFLFKTTSGLYNYFEYITNNALLYENMLSIVNSNKFYYNINGELTNNITCYQVPDNGNFACNDESFTEEDFKDGKYRGKFKYLKPSMYDINDKGNYDLVNNIYFPIVCIYSKDNDFMNDYVRSCYCNNIEESKDAIDEFFYDYINGTLGEDYSENELEHFIDNISYTIKIIITDPCSGNFKEINYDYKGNILN